MPLPRIDLGHHSPSVRGVMFAIAPAAAQIVRLKQRGEPCAQ